MKDRPESRPDFHLSTGLAPTIKLFGGSRATQKERDLSDFDQVFDLAEEILRADRRRVMQLTVAETRALALLAVNAGIVASRAADLVADYDSGAAKKTLIEKLDALGHYTRNPLRGAAP